MKIFIFTVTLVVFLVGVVFNFGYRKKSDKKITERTSKVLSQEKENEGDIKIEIEEEEGEKLEPRSETPLVPTPIFTPKFSASIFTYQYPNSEIIDFSDNSLSLTSTDETDAIINWYKEKIRGEGMNVKTFVTTKANDEVLSKLVGADGQEEIRIEISKIDDMATTKISVIFQENN
jgi:hypothetical protein